MGPVEQWATVPLAKVIDYMRWHDKHLRLLHGAPFECCGYLYAVTDRDIECPWFKHLYVGDNWVCHAAMSWMCCVLDAADIAATVDNRVHMYNVVSFRHVTYAWHDGRDNDKDMSFEYLKGPPPETPAERLRDVILRKLEG